MGQQQSRNDTFPEDKLYCSIDMDMQPVENFKTLSCGHCFCNECLDAWQDQHLIFCPKCRFKERKALTDLVEPRHFRGKVFVDQSPEPGHLKEMKELLHAQMVRRVKTIKILLAAADVITNIEINAAGFKIGGSVAGLIGTGLVITGGILSLTGVGAVAGVPLALAGGGVGGVGGLVVGGGILGEIIAKNSELKDANFYLQSDYFHSMQIRILIGRAAHDKSFAERLNVSVQDAVGFVSIAGRTAKFSVTTANFVKCFATGVARGAGTAGLHIAGIAISAVLIPLDLYQMITNSIRVHNREKAEIAMKLEEIVKDLRLGLFSILKSENYELVELERKDDQKQKHSFLLAVNKSEIESDVKFNPSLEEIEKNNVVILRNEGQLDSKQYQEIIEMWLAKMEEESDENSSGSEFSETSNEGDSVLLVDVPTELEGEEELSMGVHNNGEEFQIVREEDGVIEIQHNPQN